MIIISYLKASKKCEVRLSQKKKRDERILPFHRVVISSVHISNLKMKSLYYSVMPLSLVYTQSIRSVMNALTFVISYHVR